MQSSFEKLEANAVKFWPTYLSQEEQAASVIPKLIETQDKFIGLLHVADRSPNSWKQSLLSTTQIPANLFLKHLAVLSDVGGEKLREFRKAIPRWFPRHTMHFRWKEAEHSYEFQSLKTTKVWTNGSLHISGKKVVIERPMTSAIEDAVMFILFAGSSIAAAVPDDVVNRCVLGTLIGNKRELDSFVRQRYIYVSRITGGATANTMGQLCQRFVREYLKEQLVQWDFSLHRIPGISQNDGETDTSFDVVARSPRGKYIAIEVSFQVTTNSTIERKAGQAKARYDLLHGHGHKIAYVIDGAGNFQRAPALRTICKFSDCTVTFSQSQLYELVRFLNSSR